ncbi:acyl-[acyl-carrier-protein] thioesterase [Paenibacillus sonchi]|uniref:acyl-[acyl-carrier-protein] thioesterase n=1 Tax=Paenibacillus sonchi TaxID=373687 RepID=UPI001E650C54|nr:acyl-ACP thioesterase domain-containing protein [Paenibacillus sonchi]MCE3198663.1 acyl-ACP thioesterase [Paenibacillus sonchi]
MDNLTHLIWTEQYSVHASDTDYRSQGKLSFVLDMMQRAADSAVGGSGVGMEQMLEAGIGWMLITLELEFKRMPHPNDLLTIHTWSKGTKGALWQRDYRIFDSSQIEIATARSVWALVDIAKRKILRPSALPVKVEHYTGDSVGSMPQKVTIPPELSLVEAYRYQVRYSGLDNNSHLNNARYGELCTDTLSLKEWEQLKLAGFRISYLQEATFGEEMVILRTPITDQGMFVRGQSGETVFFEACLKFIL